MRTIFESVIKRGGYNLSGLLRKIDSYHVEGKLSDEERDSLYAQARGGADPSAGLDLMAKVKELEKRVARLEQQDTGEQEQEAAEYTAGAWYRNGDRVTFQGKVYTCTAPEDQVCTWSPSEYPAWWEAA